MNAQEKRNNLFHELYEKAEGEISCRYVPGGLSYIRGNKESLQAQIQAAEDDLNNSWLRLDPITVFRKKLRIWYDLNLSAINIFKAQKSYQALELFKNRDE